MYQSIEKELQENQNSKFQTNDTHYVFTTKTNYQSNNNLPYQEIHFDKKTFTPDLVKVLDKDKKALVEVEFSEFDTKPSFKEDRKSTRLNSSHVAISYAVFCLKKKKQK